MDSTPDALTSPFEPIAPPSAVPAAPQQDGVAPSVAMPPTAAAVHSPPASTAGERCPGCGTHLAPDQRYCLHCGQRSGEPRLPFMDATTFMDISAQRRRPAPPPPPKRSDRKRVSPNAALIAGIGTLLLAMGIGVLIGHSGQTGSSTASAPAPQVIKLGGGGEATTASTTGAGSGGGAAKKAKSTSSGGGGEATQSKAEEVIKPVAGVKLPPPKAELGEPCSQGTAGCSKNGKFEGTFFGE